MGNKDNSRKRWKAARRKHLLQNVQNIARRRLANKQINTRDLDVTASRLDVNRKTWIELTARPDLTRPETERKSHVVCSLHFDPSVIGQNALPTKLLPSQPNTSNTSNETTTKECSTQTSRNNAVIKSESVQTPEANTPRKRKLNKHLKNTKLKITKKKTSK